MQGRSNVGRRMEMLAVSGFKSTSGGSLAEFGHSSLQSILRKCLLVFHS